MARLTWGADGLLWGDRRAVWGAAPLDPLAPIDPRDNRVNPPQAGTQGVYYFHSLIRFERVFDDDEDLYTWSGNEQLEFGGVTYIGNSGLVDVTGMGAVAGGVSPDVQLAIIIGSDDDADLHERLRDFREIVNRHLPPVRTHVSFIMSDDGGETWRLSPVVKVGRFSDAKIQDNLLIGQVASEDVTAYRGDELIWSDENQKRRYPGDRGFEKARAIAERNVTIKFPRDPDDQFDSMRSPFPSG